jgi:hypothetical protein
MFTTSCTVFVCMIPLPGSITTSTTTAQRLTTTLDTLRILCIEGVGGVLGVRGGTGTTGTGTVDTGTDAISVWVSTSISDTGITMVGGCAASPIGRSTGATRLIAAIILGTTAIPGSRVVTLGTCGMPRTGDEPALRVERCRAGVPVLSPVLRRAGRER